VKNHEWVVDGARLNLRTARAMIWVAGFQLLRAAIVLLRTYH
jgi:hypothetical protein